MQALKWFFFFKVLQNFHTLCQYFFLFILLVFLSSKLIYILQECFFKRKFLKSIFLLLTYRFFLHVLTKSNTLCMHKLNPVACEDHKRGPLALQGIKSN